MDPRRWNCSQVIQWLSSFNKNQHVLDIFTSKWSCYVFAQLSFLLTMCRKQTAL